VCEVHYDGESATVWEDSYHKARKAHVCDCCGGAIDPGEVYRRTFCIFNKSITDGKACALCALAIETYREMHHGFQWTPDYMREALQECVLEADSTYNEETDEYDLGPEGLFWQRELDEMDARRAELHARIATARTELEEMARAQ
jgi:hypothetical protein